MNQEDVLRENLKNTPDAQLLILYSIGRYHEKFKFTKIVMEVLNEKGYQGADLFGFDSRFADFYHGLINSTEL